MAVEEPRARMDLVEQDEDALVPGNAAEARAHVREVLLAAGIGPDTLRNAWSDALLVTSELVTNAILHAGGLTGFRARVVNGALHLHISDASGEEPVARDPVDSAVPGGFGLPIVERLCRWVGTEPRLGPGKTVVAILPLTASD